VRDRVSVALRAICASLPTRPKVVANLGSGGIAFDVEADLHIHLDLVAQRLPHESSVLANIELVPLRGSSVDLALCLGSVINHGDVSAMISELARITRPAALAIIEFDCADGLHQRVKTSQDGVLVYSTFFNMHTLTLAEYSRSHVEQTLAARGFVVERRLSFHILSAWLLGLGVQPEISAHFIHLDPIARLASALRYRGSNMLLVARRA